MRRLVMVMLLVLWAPSVLAKGWDRPDLTLRLSALTTSDMFPGSTLSRADRGFELAAESETGLRLSDRSKLGVSALVGGSVFDHFSEASRAWGGGGLSLRRAGTQFGVAAELRPDDLKFPGTVDEGGRFARTEYRFSVRQSIGAATRLKAELRRRSDDYRAPYDVRDTEGLEYAGQVAVKAGRSASLRLDASAGTFEAISRKYTQAEREVSGAIGFTGTGWRSDVSVASGRAQYPDAISGDSNFKRRDQWLRTRLNVVRSLGESLALLGAAELYDQTSTRPDRTYTTHGFRLGLEWNMPRK